MRPQDALAWWKEAAKNHAKSPRLAKGLKPSIHALFRPVYPHNLPTLFRDEPKLIAVVHSFVPFSRVALGEDLKSPDPPEQSSFVSLPRLLFALARRSLARQDGT